MIWQNASFEAITGTAFPPIFTRQLFAAKAPLSYSMLRAPHEVADIADAA